VLLTEHSGQVVYENLIEDITIQEKLNVDSGKSSYVVLESRDARYQPLINIVSSDGEEAHYYLPSNSYLAVTNGQQVSSGDVLVKTPREVSKTKDITGGLPRIAELFEARAPKNPAIISDIDGQILFGGLHRGLRKISVVSGEHTFDYFIPRGQQLNVVEGEQIKAGDLITLGSPVLHDVLRILGPDVVQHYLVDQIQQIYRLQGVHINDKHIELIVRQMMRKVRIIDAGDTDFLIGDKVDRVHFQSINKMLKEEGKNRQKQKQCCWGLHSHL